MTQLNVFDLTEISYKISFFCLTNLLSSRRSCCTPPQLLISVLVSGSSQSWTRTQATLHSSFRCCPYSRLSSTGRPSSSLTWSLTCHTGDRSLNSSALSLEEKHQVQSGLASLHVFTVFADNSFVRNLSVFLYKIKQYKER